MSNLLKYPHVLHSRNICLILLYKQQLVVLTYEIIGVVRLLTARGKRIVKQDYCLILALGYQCGHLEKNQKLLRIIILTLCLNMKNYSIYLIWLLWINLNFTTTILTCYCRNTSLILTSQTEELTIHKFNCRTIEFGEWIGNFIPHFIGHVITYPY